MFRVQNQEEPTVTAHGTLLRVMCQLDGRGVWGRMDTCIGMAESLHCLPETITTLLIGYKIQYKMCWVLKKKKRISLFVKICGYNMCVHIRLFQSGETLCNFMDCNPPGSSVHGILQARILEWIAIPFSRPSFQPRDWTHISTSPALASGLFTTCIT